MHGTRDALLITSHKTSETTTLIFLHGNTGRIACNEIDVDSYVGRIHQFNSESFDWCAVSYPSPRIVFSVAGTATHEIMVPEDHRILPFCAFTSKTSVKMCALGDGKSVTIYKISPEAQTLVSLTPLEFIKNGRLGNSLDPQMVIKPSSVIRDFPASRAMISTNEPTHKIIGWNPTALMRWDSEKDSTMTFKQLPPQPGSLISDMMFIPSLDSCLINHIDSMGVRLEVYNMDGKRTFRTVADRRDISNPLRVCMVGRYEFLTVRDGELWEIFDLRKPNEPGFDVGTFLSLSTEDISNFHPSKNLEIVSADDDTHVFVIEHLFRDVEVIPDIAGRSGTLSNTVSKWNVRTKKRVWKTSIPAKLDHSTLMRMGASDALSSTSRETGDLLMFMWLQQPGDTRLVFQNVRPLLCYRAMLV